MTSVDEFPNTNPCEKLDPWCIDAYFDLKLTPADSAELTLDSSWGTVSVDLTPAVKKAETVTNLFLTDSALQFNREDYGRDDAPNGGVDCISGNALSRIISMKYLKDVDQTTTPTTGDVYMFNTAQNVFQPYNLQTFIDATNNSISNINNQLGELRAGLTDVNARIDAAISDYNSKINNLQTQVTNNATAIANLQTAFNNYKTTTDNRLNAIEATIAKPSWAPSNAALAWGNINYESNYDPTGHLIGTHNPNTPVTGDGQFK